MHPAASVILFTTAAGAGYGLLFLLGLALPMGLLPAARGFGLVAMILSLGLITLGLLASTLLVLLVVPACYTVLEDLGYAKAHGHGEMAAETA